MQFIADYSLWCLRIFIPALQFHIAFEWWHLEIKLKIKMIKIKGKMFCHKNCDCFYSIYLYECVCVWGGWGWLCDVYIISTKNGFKETHALSTLKSLKTNLSQKPWIPLYFRFFSWDFLLLLLLLLSSISAPFFHSAHPLLTAIKKYYDTICMSHKLWLLLFIRFCAFF